LATPAELQNIMSHTHSVILSEAKDLMAVANGIPLEAA
jgi:hypothetical protein